MLSAHLVIVNLSPPAPAAGLAEAGGLAHRGDELVKARPHDRGLQDRMAATTHRALVDQPHVALSRDHVDVLHGPVPPRGDELIRGSVGVGTQLGRHVRDDGPRAAVVVGDREAHVSGCVVGRACPRHR